MSSSDPVSDSAALAVPPLKGWRRALGAGLVGIAGVLVLALIVARLVDIASPAKPAAQVSVKGPLQQDVAMLRDKAQAWKDDRADDAAPGTDAAALDAAPDDSGAGASYVDDRAASVPAPASAVAQMPSGPSLSAAKWNDVQTRLVQIEARLASAEEKASQKQATADEAVQKIQILAGLIPVLMAADRGGGFDALFQAWQATLPDAYKTMAEPLAAFAAQGAPSRAALVRMLDEKAAHLDTAMAEAQAQGWMDRVRIALRSLIRVRGPQTADQQAGEGAADAADPVRQALLAGRDADALAAIAALPETARAALNPLRMGLETRHALDEAVHQILARMAGRGA